MQVLAIIFFGRDQEMKKSMMCRGDYEKTSGLQNNLKKGYLLISPHWELFFSNRSGELYSHKTKIGNEKRYVFYRLWPNVKIVQF